MTHILPETDDDEVIFLGSKAPSVTTNVKLEHSNKHFKKPLVFGLPNVQIDKKTWAHLLCCAPNGFSQENGRPRPGFHSFVIKIRIKDGDIAYFDKRGVTEANVTDITLKDGSYVIDPGYPDRQVTAFVIYTLTPLSDRQLAKQADDFLEFVNTLKWKTTVLANRAALLLPTTWLKNEKIGEWIGPHGVHTLVKKIDSGFKPYELWADEHQNAAKNFWSPGSWSYTNAAYFGVMPDWMDDDGKCLHAEALAKEKEEEGRTAETF